MATRQLQLKKPDAIVVVVLTCSGQHCIVLHLARYRWLWRFASGQCGVSSGGYGADTLKCQEDPEHVKHETMWIPSESQHYNTGNASQRWSLHPRKKTWIIAFITSSGMIEGREQLTGQIAGDMRATSMYSSSANLLQRIQQDPYCPRKSWPGGYLVHFTWHKQWLF